jgi:fluoroacetyl-CoA thioesterase
MEEIIPGLVGQTELLVGEENTARHLGSGNVAVLATPEMVRLMEKAAVAAVDHLLPDGYRTVGVAVNVRHLAATPVGMRVRAQAELVTVEGRKLTFRVEAFDEVEKIGEGEHRRVIVELERFRERVEAKSASSGVMDSRSAS